MVLGELRDVLEPVLPGTREAMDEKNGRPNTQLDVGRSSADHVDFTAVLRPLDAQPLRVGIAVGVRAVGRGGGGQVNSARCQSPGVAGVPGDPAKLIAYGPRFHRGLGLLDGLPWFLAHAYPIRSRIGISRIWRLGTEGLSHARNVPIRPGYFRLFRCLTGEQMANKSGRRRRRRSGFFRGRSPVTVPSGAHRPIRRGDKSRNCDKIAPKKPQFAATVLDMPL